jgi:hypothetical protein
LGGWVGRRREGFEEGGEMQRGGTKGVKEKGWMGGIAGTSGEVDGFLIPMLGIG